jgi:Zn-dependent peptidase ImmA (M78 family)/DNA-binding XRE family transcriptional regulator
LIKLDFGYEYAHNPQSMHRVIHSEALEKALQARGWTQANLAKEIGVSAQAVTNWMTGAGFPRPDKLLKLATTLRLGFEQLVKPAEDQPVIAFRKKANTKTTDEHILKAVGMGSLLKPLVPFLPDVRTLRTKIASPEIAINDYARLQSDVAQVRKKLGVGESAVINYHTLIAEFKASGAVLIPVLWGQKQRHENALHILLPKEDVTFIFLNLDTKLEDFKFWMAHELAHVYTPELAGTDAGEDFADAFAGALLFPQTCAHAAYVDLSRAHTANGELQALARHAQAHEISLNTVYRQVTEYVKANGLPALSIAEKQIHMTRNSRVVPLVSTALFDPPPPKPAQYIAAAKNTFQSDFFEALEKMIHAQGTGVSYVQQVMDVSLQDATALHGELVR